MDELFWWKLGALVVSAGAMLYAVEQRYQRELAQADLAAAHSIIENRDAVIELLKHRFNTVGRDITLLYAGGSELDEMGDVPTFDPSLN